MKKSVYRIILMAAGALQLLFFFVLPYATLSDMMGALSGLGKTFLCSVISISLTSARIPLAMFLGSTSLGLNGIWWALTISSVAKGLVFFINYMMILKRLPGEEL